VAVTGAASEKNEPRILIGADARLMDILQRLQPAGHLLVDAGLADDASEDVAAIPNTHRHAREKKMAP
jgi:hypothetical protein